MGKIRNLADPHMERQSTSKILHSTGDRADRRGGGSGGRRRWLWPLGIGLVVSVLAYMGFRAARALPLNADELWQQAERDFAAGRYEVVDESLARLKRMREPTPLDLFLRAQLAMARNDNDQALELLARVPDEHYMAAQARLMAGQTELRRKRMRLSEQLFRTALKLDPRLIQAHRELIYIYGMQLRRRELSGEFDALSKLTALTFDNVFHWCLLRNNTWEPAEAVETLASYVAADPSDRSSRLALAENYLRMNRLEDAESTIASLPPDDSEAIELGTRIALERQDPEEARRLLAKGRDGDPLVARLRGRLALSNGDFKAAVKNFRIAYSAGPEDRETIFGLMVALESTGDKKAAGALRVTAGNLDRLSTLVQRASVSGARRDAGLMRQLGAASAALDRKGEARAWYKLAIDLDPLDADSQQALFRLNDTSANTRASSSPMPTD
jgi:tetratricopeptide (TPR) repeat protein